MLRAVVDSGNVVIDLTWVYPEVAELRKALAREDWPAARAVLDRVEPAERTVLIRIGSERAGQADFLRRVVAENPADSAAAAVLGAHLIEVGWRIRTRQQAQYVSQAQFAQFHELLGQAE